MIRATFQHEQFAILEHSFAFNLLIAGGADGYDYIVEKIRTGFLRHMRHGLGQKWSECVVILLSGNATAVLR